MEHLKYVSIITPFILYYNIKMYRPAASTRERNLKSTRFFLFSFLYFVSLPLPASSSHYSIFSFWGLEGWVVWELGICRKIRNGKWWKEKGRRGRRGESKIVCNWCNWIYWILACQNSSSKRLHSSCHSPWSWFLTLFYLITHSFLYLFLFIFLDIRLNKIILHIPIQ